MNHEPLTLAFLILLVLIAFVIVLCGKDKVAMYRQDVIYLENFVNRNIVTRDNYDFILREFDKLSRNNQDKDRTKDLWKSFTAKYRDFWPEAALKKSETAMICKLQKELA